MQSKFILAIPLFLLTLTVSAQTDGNTIEDQFEDVIEKSNNYQEYKVVKKVKLNSLRKSILDSVNSLETEIKATRSKIEEQKGQIASLTEELSGTQQNLAASIAKEDGIEFFGVLTKKSTYNSIMWSIIGLLIAALVFLTYKFRKNNAVTQEANLRLAETEEEFDMHRQKTLEREQQLRRKLQDEINKNRKL